ncbi:MAG: type III secretion system inner membrane ring subunit SctD [Deltaproteobacteria bacterium]|nr:type III secretion system inner membrane ring subunit SctD [Deltaproteobacteria bacterium]
MNDHLDKGLLLGIFTGNHAGAEAHFEAGEYTIGSAPECDVALTDSTLAPRHCSFSLAEDGAVRLAPLEGTLTLEGENLSAPADWPACAPVLAGMVCLAWTRPEQGWTGMKLPSLLGGEEKPEKEPAKPEETLPAAGDKPRRLRRLAAGGAALLSLFALIIGLAPSDNQGEARLKALKQTLLAEGFPDLWVEESAGRAMIYGLVPTEVDANKVRSIAAGQSYPIQVIVREKGAFIRAIQAALAGQGLFPQVLIEGGQATLSGYALDSLTENAALSWARSAVPQVAPIRSAMLTRGAVEERLMTELAKAGLAGKVSVDWRPGVIVLKGEAEDGNALTAVMEAVRIGLGSPIAFQLALASEQAGIDTGEAAGEIQDPPYQAPVRAERGDPFGGSLALRSVTPVQNGGGPPFITTSDGEVYFLGGTLPGGYKLTGIYADRLEFSRNGTTMAYKLQGR